MKEYPLRFARAIPPALRRASRAIRTMPRFAVALIGAVLITIVLTVVSVAIYVSSGVSSIDLSRPGFEQARNQLKSGDINPAFSPTGPLNSQTMDTFMKFYKVRTDELQNSSSFNDGVIDDANLGLFPAASPAPTAP
jgi:hypothetical protein